MPDLTRSELFILASLFFLTQLTKIMATPIPALNQNTFNATGNFTETPSPSYNTSTAPVDGTAPQDDSSNFFLVLLVLFVIYGAKDRSRRNNSYSTNYYQGSFNSNRYHELTPFTPPKLSDTLGISPELKAFLNTIEESESKISTLSQEERDAMKIDNPDYLDHTTKDLMDMPVILNDNHYDFQHLLRLAIERDGLRKDPHTESLFALDTILPDPETRAKMIQTIQSERARLR